MDFFSKCNTQEEAKETFRRLCKCFHPDKGGEEALMIDLKNQYDNWKPSYGAQNFNIKFNRFNKLSNISLDSVYEQKINELNILLYNSRNELAALRISHQFNIDVLRAERIEKNQYKDEASKLQAQVDALNQHKNRSLADKIKTVFGYE